MHTNPAVTMTLARLHQDDLRRGFRRSRRTRPRGETP